MPVDVVTQVILQYKYWILIPLTFIEGPIIAFVAGALASIGYFNIYFLAALFFIRDVGLDSVYYAIGYFGGRTAFAERMLAKLGITDDHVEQIRVLWTRRPGTTLFIGKLSYGIASAFIVVAGIVRMPFRIFLIYGTIVAILQYGTLLLVGYFLGVSFGGDIVPIIRNVQYVIAFAAIALMGYFVFTLRMRNRLLKEKIEDFPIL